MGHPHKIDAKAFEAIVYIREVAAADLPPEVQDQLEGTARIFSLNRPDGERVALVSGRELAFAVALQNDLAPVSVH